MGECVVTDNVEGGFRARPPPILFFSRKPILHYAHAIHFSDVGMAFLSVGADDCFFSNKKGTGIGPFYVAMLLY